ncbi:MAG: hypothetical protein FOGNACKC_04345 [Anaerolineae bacterium]|nr:hypothetical protein [Anaerolineae bacterium]
METAHINLLFAWLWIALGFVSGSMIGFNFKFFQDGWIGGYSGLRRRLYRLGHFSFFGLAFVNLMFYFTIQSLALSGYLVTVAAWSFMVGAVTMPIFCFTMAHYPSLKNLLYIPVISLIVGGFITFWEVMQL